jgi:hypothetical protein
MTGTLLKKFISQRGPCRSRMSSYP